MLIKLILVITFVLLSVAFSWLSGYQISPALFGGFTPIVGIILFVTPFVVTLWMIFKLIKGKVCSSQELIMCSIAFISTAFLFSPFKPTSLDGFYYRMSLIGKEAFEDAAKIVKFEAKQREVELINREFKEVNRLDTALKGKSIFYTLGPLPPRVGYLDNCLRLSWGSGLTGSYEVDINLGGSSKECVQRKFSRSKKLYSNVIISTAS